jgi:transcriptional regulator with XRE-family HTH domain
MLRLNRDKRTKYLNQNLRFLINEFGIELEDLSLETGLSIPTIHKLKQGNVNPTINTLESLAGFFRVDVESFLYDDMTSIHYKDKKYQGKLSYLPLIDLKNVENWKKKSHTTKLIASAGVDQKNCFCIQLNTDLMMPVFKNNSILIVNTMISPNQGDYIICKLDHEDIVIIRQIFFEGTTLFLKIINNFSIEKVDPNKIEIFGVIIKSIESFR